MSEKQTITTSVTKRTSIKLPHELANHPHLANATVTVNEDLVTFVVPCKDPEDKYAEVWQYVHRKKTWAVVTFN